MAGCRTESVRCFRGSAQGTLPHAHPAPACPTGGNRITQTVPGAHDGGVFGLCALRDGTLVSGGGRDRRVVFWGPDYSKLQEVEVRGGRGSSESEETLPLLSPTLSPSSLLRVRCPGARGLRPRAHRGRGPGRHAVRGDHPQLHPAGLRAHGLLAARPGELSPCTCPRPWPTVSLLFPVLTSCPTPFLWPGTHHVPSPPCSCSITHPGPRTAPQTPHDPATNQQRVPEPRSR